MKPPFRKRLGDEHDKFAFLLAFLGGLVAIVTVRLIGDFLTIGDVEDASLLQSGGIGFSDLLAIIIAVCVIIGYFAYIIVTKDRSGVSVDRASDNVYYLGLLFTLASLAYSLIKLSFIVSLENVGRSGHVLTLLPDFGLALASTIAGILFRILLQQMRNDPMDVETEAREELGIAIRQLRETIGQVVSNLNGLSAQTSVSLTELNQAVSRTLEQSANQTAEMVRSVTSEVSELNSKIQAVSRTLEQSANQTTEMVRGVTSEVSELNSKIQIQVTEITNFTTNSITQFNKIIGNVQDQFEGLSRISGVVEDIERFNTALSGIGDQVETLNSTLERIGNYGKKIEASVESVDDANTEYVAELNKAVETLRSKTDEA